MVILSFYKVLTLTLHHFYLKHKHQNMISYKILRPSFHQVHSDEACLSENLASAKWCRDGPEAKGQPEDRWQANHVENESLEGKCRGGDGG